MAAPDILTQFASGDRLFYATGTMLNADDLIDEQAYHRGQLARALRYLHGTGTVAGLRVEFADATEEVVVQPGMAIDRVGRVVVVPRKACIRVAKWFANIRDNVKTAGKLTAAFDGANVLADVFLRYARCERGKTPAFAEGLLEALDAAVPARVRDWYALDMIPARDPNVPPVLPPDPWEGLTAANQLDTVFDAWKDELTDLRDQNKSRFWSDAVERIGLAEGELPRSTAVFLARVPIPATVVNPGEVPTRTANGAVVPDNSARRLVLPAAAVARLAGLA
jgi:hypothetical protein